MCHDGCGQDAHAGILAAFVKGLSSPAVVAFQSYPAALAQPEVVRVKSRAAGFLR